MSTGPSLLDRLRLNDQAAKKQFYMEYFDLLVRIPLKYVRSKNEAITIVNDGFIKIYASISKLEDDNSLIPWCSSIMRNTTIDHVRKKVKHTNRVTPLENDSPVAVTKNTAIQSLAMEEIMELVHSLDDTERIVFCMFAIDGFKHMEIATALNMSEGTSKWYLNKARTNLKSLLNQHIS